MQYDATKVTKRYGVKQGVIRRIAMQSDAIQCKSMRCNVMQRRAMQYKWSIYNSISDCKKNIAKRFRSYYQPIAKCIESFRNCCAITMCERPLINIQSLCNNSSIAAQSLDNLCVVIFQFLCSLSICDRFTIALESFCYCFAIARQPICIS
jgi:hypothetical protein